MDNSSLGQMLSEYLSNYRDVYHGNVEKAIEDILSEKEEEAYYSVDKHGNVIVVNGEFYNGEEIDIRVTFEKDEETQKLIEVF